VFKRDLSLPPLLRKSKSCRRRNKERPPPDLPLRGGGNIRKGEEIIRRMKGKDWIPDQVRNDERGFFGQPFDNAQDCERVEQTGE
jgi:hypothetical protein